MEENKYVVPIEGTRIRYPDQPLALLPTEGALVPWRGKLGVFWRRRARDRSVTVYSSEEEYTNKMRKKLYSSIVPQHLKQKKEDNK